MREGDGGFGGVWEGEEGFGGGEHMLDFWERNAVVRESKEAICFGGVDELEGDFFDATVKVVEGNFGNRPFGVLGGCHLESW